MSFDPKFEARWTHVLQPGIAAVAINGQRLDPFRVDLSRKSDAILTEILESIAHCSLIVADISSTAELDGRAVRNANVMYELGIAHSVRLPEEVILLRSDAHRLDFDITGVRVHSYSPDEAPEESRKMVSELVIDALKGREGKQRAAVAAASQRLTTPALTLLLLAAVSGKLKHPPAKTVRDVLSSISISDSISLLLELGAIKANPFRLTPESIETVLADASDPALLDYDVTPFGKAIVAHIAETMGSADPAVQAALAEYENRSKRETV